MYLVCVKYPILLSFFILFSITGRCQTSAGTDFWLGFMSAYSNQDFYITITSETGASGTLDVPGLGINQAFTVAPNSSTTLFYTSGSNLEVGTSETPDNKGIHITSDNPVSVYALATVTHSSDGTLILPTTSLGVDHMITTYRPMLLQYPAEFMVVATANNTSIEIIPSAQTINGSLAGVPINIVLNQGECYQVKSTSDLTGSTVRVTDSVACKPIAVFEGNECAIVPYTHPSCDHLFEQSMPVAVWGKEFITTPFRDRGYYTVTITASQNNTQFSVDNGPPQILNAGQVFEDTWPSAAKYISADKPVKVTQYTTSTMLDNQLGDPSALYVSPVEQQIGKIVFENMTTPNIVNTYLNVLTETAFINDITLDGAPVPPGNFVAVPQNPAYSYAALSVPAGPHILESTTGTLSGTIYGFGPFDSYSMNVGGGFAFIPPVDFNPSVSIPDTLGCSDTLIIPLPMDSAVASVSWWLNGGTPVYSDTIVISSYNNGTNTIDIRYIMQGGSVCIPPDTIHLSLTFEAEKTLFQDIVPDTVVCNVDSFPVMITDPQGSIVWDDGSSSNPRYISADGTYWLTVTRPDQCEVTDTFRVTYTHLVFDLGPDSMLCPPAIIVLLSPVTGDTYQWSTSENTEGILISAPGIYSLTVTANGCSYTDSIEFFAAPAPDFSLPPDTILCTGDSMILYGPPGFDSYLWSTGDITDSITVNTEGTYWLSVSACQQHVSDSIHISVYSSDDYELPNVFTPNGDGINDEWFINFAAASSFTTYRISIYNRWGILVWESFDALEKWNGMFNDIPATEGVYHYVFEIASPCIPYRITPGFITLSR